MKKQTVGLALGVSIAIGTLAVANGTPSANRTSEGALSGAPLAAPPNPLEQREILILFSEDMTQPWTQRFAEGFGDVAMRETPGPVLYFEYMDAARFRQPTDIDRFRDWLNSKYARRDIDVIVPVGEPAMAFAAQNRDVLWPGADVYFLGLRPPDSHFTTQLPDAGGIILEDNLRATLEALKSMLPGTHYVEVVRGTSESERAWLGEVPNIVKAVGLELREAPLRPLPDMLEHVATLPDGTLLLVLGPLVDTSGRVTLAASLCTAISQAANAPTIMPGSHFLGCGIIGGVLRDFRLVGRRVAADVLDHSAQNRGTVSVLPVAQFTTTVFDARQLRRWGVPESRLPPGSNVLFREPNLWRDYRPAVLAAIGAIVFQSALILGLLYERQRRRVAERASRRDLAVAARAARLTAMGELTASIAHELAQPLGAILHNVEAARLLLKVKSPSLDEIVEILEDVGQQDLRAREILARIRALVQKRETEAAPVDLNAVVDESLRLLAHEANSRGVYVQRELSPSRCIVLGDRVHLQQVVVNLVLNAVEAMADTAQSQRRVVVRTTTDSSGVSLTVHDGGPGLTGEVAGRVFEPFVTTKPQGLGIGLSIARSIVAAHGGDIELVNDATGGATARVSLPSYADAA